MTEQCIWDRRQWQSVQWSWVDRWCVAEFKNKHTSYVSCNVQVGCFLDIAHYFDELQLMFGFQRVNHTLKVDPRILQRSTQRGREQSHSRETDRQTERRNMQDQALVRHNKAKKKSNNSNRKQGRERLERDTYVKIEHHSHEDRQTYSKLVNSGILSEGCQNTQPTIQRNVVLIAVQELQGGVFPAASDTTTASHGESEGRRVEVLASCQRKTESSMVGERDRDRDRESQ
jgi:hypothetical protein